MPTFILKKYEEPQNTNPEKSDSPEGGSNSKEVEKESETIQIHASDSISKIVAQALHKALPNVDIVEQEKADSQPTDSAVQVVSTEEINLDPVKTLARIKANQKVLILNGGFKTAKEEWFLQTLENRKIKAFYSVVSLARHVETKLG